MMFKKLKKTVVILLLISLVITPLTLALKVNAQNTTSIGVISPAQVKKNTDFFATIHLDQAEPVVTVQIDLSFDPSLLQCNNVTNGNPDVWTTFFPPNINNTDGRIHGACVAVMGDTVSSSVDCFNISFTSKTNGISSLDLENIYAYDGEANQIKNISVINADIIIGNDSTIEEDEDDNFPSDENDTSQNNNQKPTIKENFSGPTNLYTDRKSVV